MSQPESRNDSTRTWLNHGLDVLEPLLRERVVELRRQLPGSKRGIPIAQEIGFALEAGFAGDQVSAAICIAQAEKLTAEARRMAEARRLVTSAEPTSSSSRTIARRGLIGHVKAVGPDGGLIAATDGSHDRHGHSGWAYLSTDGKWGCQAGQYTASAVDKRNGVVGGSGALVAELRAAYLALTTILGPLTVMTDSTGAISLLKAWQVGHLDQMPANYSLRPRTSGRKPTLALLAELTAQRGSELRFTHVKGHTGDLLNEAADALADIARRWYCRPSQPGPAAMTAKAADLASAFLATWTGRQAQCGLALPSRDHVRPGVAAACTPRSLPGCCT